VLADVGRLEKAWRRVLRVTLESTAKYIGKYRSLDAQLKVNALSDEEQQLLQKPLTDADFIALMTAYHATLA
jgi:predicted ATPase